MARARLTCLRAGLLSGNDKIDTLAGEDGQDKIRGLGAKDLLMGGPGNDVIYGGPSRDKPLYGQDGEDVIYGGPGNDTELLGAGDGLWDKLYCGEGRDSYTADKVDYVSSSCEKKFRPSKAPIPGKALGRVQKGPVFRRIVAWSAERPSSVLPTSDNSIMVKFGGHSPAPKGMIYEGS